MGRGIKHEQATIALRMRRKKEFAYQNETDGNSNSLRTMTYFRAFFLSLTASTPPFFLLFRLVLISAGAIGNHDLMLK